MVKGKLERKYKLIHNGRELSKGLLSEAGKFDAMQILVQRFDEGRPDAIDPDEVEIIDMSLKENQQMTVPVYDIPESPILIVGFFGILFTLVLLYVVNRDYFGSPLNEDRRK